MEFSEDIQEVLQFLDGVTNNGLRKRQDFGMLLEIAARHEASEEFNSLVFAGKCCWNVYSSFRKLTPASEGYQTLEKEMASTIGALRAEVVFFAANAESAAERNLEQSYLGMGGAVAGNLLDLAHDLARFKDVQNQRKHNPGS